MTDTSVPAGNQADEMIQIGGAIFSPEQEAEMARWAVEDGRLTQAEADAMLAGKSPDNPAENPNLDHAAAAVIDGEFPPARPEHFQIPTMSDGEINDVAAALAREAGKTPGEAAAAVTAALKTLSENGRAWLADGRFTREIGNSLAKEINKVGERFNGVKDPTARKNQLDLYWAHEKTVLERLWKGDFERKLNLADRLISELNTRRPGLVDLLTRTGALSSATVMAYFGDQAERLEYRLKR